MQFCTISYTPCPARSFHPQWRRHHEHWPQFLRSKILQPRTRQPYHICSQSRSWAEAFTQPFIGVGWDGSQGPDQAALQHCSWAACCHHPLLSGATPNYMSFQCRLCNRLLQSHAFIIQNTYTCKLYVHQMTPWPSAPKGLNEGTFSVVFDWIVIGIQDWCYDWVASLYEYSSMNPSWGQTANKAA